MRTSRAGHVNRPRVRGALRKAGLSVEESIAALGMLSRIAFASQFVRDAHGRPWNPHDYQRLSLESRALRKCHCDGRKVGKTSEIVILAGWASVVMPRSSMIVATMSENALVPIMRSVADLFVQTGPLAGNLEKLVQSPSWYLRFKNGFTLHGRIAGPRGINFQGMHNDIQVVDEAQQMSDEAWGELLPGLNPNGARWVYGVPDGRRNAFFDFSQSRDYEQYNWPSTLNPAFTPARDNELAAFYGGRRSAGYLHNVLGRHGAPENSVFNANAVVAAVSKSDAPCVFRLSAEGLMMNLDASMAHLNFGRMKGEFVLGMDLGFAESPTEIVLWRRREGDHRNLQRVARWSLRGVTYPDQIRVLEFLDGIIPLSAIAVDAGGPGAAVAQQIADENPALAARLFAVVFSRRAAWLSQADIGVPPLPVKVLLTSKLQALLESGSIEFSHDTEAKSQYLAHTFRVTAGGITVYSKGEDHIIDADRCAIYALFRDDLITGYQEGQDPLLPVKVAAW